MTNKRYIVEMFTGMPSQPQDTCEVDTPEEVLNILRNVSDPISRVRRLTIQINPSGEPLIASVEERVRDYTERALEAKWAFEGRPMSFLEASRVDDPAYDDFLKTRGRNMTDESNLKTELVILGGSDLDHPEWNATNDRFCLLHNGKTVATSISDGVPYVDRMMDFYVETAGLESPPPDSELEVVKVTLAFHVGDRLKFKYEDSDCTGRVAHVLLGDDGKPLYVMEDIDPPVTMEIDHTLAGTADEFSFA